MKGVAFGTILFAVDESSHMRAAAYSVARLASATHSEVILLHVEAAECGKLETAPGPAPSTRIEQIAKVVANAGVQTTIETRFAAEDAIAETIAAVAKQLNVGMVALGSRGLSDLSGLFRGSVSHQVIARSDCPVLVVRYGVRRPGGSIRRILLAIAGGEDVPHALEAAMTIARATDAEVLVLHARYLVTGLDSWPYVEPDEYAEQTVVRVVRRLRTAGIRAVAHSPIAGTGIARAVGGEAQALDADLVVVGSRRLSDLASLLLGGIDHDVIQLSDRPVLIAERPEAPVPEPTRESHPRSVASKSQQETQKGRSVIVAMIGQQVSIGQEVSLGGDNSDWLLVDRAEGKHLRLRRSFGDLAVYSSGFWTEATHIRAVRWPVHGIGRGLT